MNKKEETFNILLIDDDADSIMIARRALKEINLSNKIWFMENGEKALDFLNRSKKGKARYYPRPDLILLDLNLPRMGGIEILERVKGDDDLRNIPTVILTGSVRDVDKVRSYKLGCNSYIQKSSRFEDFSDVIKKVSEYWGKINVSPPA